MRFLDFLTENRDLQSAINRIEDQIPQLSAHIIKVWVMPESRDFNHWINEIKNYTQIIDDSADVKTRFGRIRKTLMLKELQQKLSVNRVTRYIRTIEDKYNIRIPGILEIRDNLEALYNDFFDYIEKDSYEDRVILNLINLHKPEVLEL